MCEDTPKVMAQALLSSSNSNRANPTSADDRIPENHKSTCRYVVPSEAIDQDPGSRLQRTDQHFFTNKILAPRLTVLVALSLVHDFAFQCFLLFLDTKISRDKNCLFLGFVRALGFPFDLQDNNELIRLAWMECG